VLPETVSSYVVKQNSASVEKHVIGSSGGASQYAWCIKQVDSVYAVERAERAERAERLL